MDEEPEFTYSPDMMGADSPGYAENVDPVEMFDEPEHIDLTENTVDDNAIYADVLDVIQNYESEEAFEHITPDFPSSPILSWTAISSPRSPNVEAITLASTQPLISNVDRNVQNEETNSLASCPEQSDRHTDDVDEPPAKMRKVSSPKQEDGEGETCPICLDTWSNSGEHRLVALKCGHLFGWQCVERWLKAQATKDRTCPTCKSKATLKDMRFIFARRLVAADTTQLTAMQKEIDILKSENSRMELELLKSKIAHSSYVQQLKVLRSTLMKRETSMDVPRRKSWRFALEKNQEVNKDGGCRVLTYNCRTYELYVSQKSTNNLFPGYGIRKVSCIDYKLGQFIHLHPKPIRDITYSQPRDLLLSVSLDSSVRIIERGIPSASIQCGVPLWSCSWDYLRSNEFYVGGVGGVIHQYDVRNTNNTIQTLNTNDLSPVVSLCSTEHGLLSCQLNSCWLWESNMRQFAPKSIPIDGPFVSLCYDNDTHRALITTRANENSRSKLTLFKLKPNNREMMFDLEQTFVGSARSTLMSRRTFVRAPGAAWAASHSESDSTLYLYGLDGARTMSLPAVEPALDICTAQVNSDTIVAALSEARLRLYKAVATNS